MGLFSRISEAAAPFWKDAKIDFRPTFAQRAAVRGNESGASRMARGAPMLAEDAPDWVAILTDPRTDHRELAKLLGLSESAGNTEPGRRMLDNKRQRLLQEAQYLIAPPQDGQVM